MKTLSSRLRNVAGAGFALGLMLCAPARSEAALITIGTTLTFEDTGLMTPIDPAQISPGDRFAVALTFDTSILDVDGSSNAYGPLASFPTAAVSLSITRDPSNTGIWDAPEILSYSNPATFTIFSNQQGVTRAVNIDFYFSGLTVPKSTSGDFIWTQMKFNFAIDPLGVDTGVGQPLSAFLPGADTWASWTIHNYFTDPGDMLPPHFFITYTAPEVIPEPSTYLLSAMGVSLGLLYRRRRKVAQGAIASELPR